jgi:hypothetical protein
MANWNESEYVQRAGEIAQQHVTSKKPLNELATKVARDNSLNPDEIRTLVRLSNVATFQQLFKDKNDGDKMVEFDTGDPESVINSLVQEAQTPPETANISNDKLASEIPDQMREKRQGFKFAPMEKTAADGDFVPASEKLPRKDMVVLALRKLAEDFEVERIAAGARWESKLAELARVFKRPAGYGPTVEIFEKDAYAEYGSEIRPELAQLRFVLRLPFIATDLEKIAELQARHVSEDTPELHLLKEAHDARVAYLKYKNGLVWIEHNMPVL